jgi:SAM-dependent methyltransferase
MNEFSGQKIYEKILKHAALKSRRVLEIGCGSGRISSHLAREPELLVSIDPDENKIQQAKNSFHGIDFRIGSGEELDFSDSCFDLVIFTLSLHHQNSKKAISEACRVLSAGGQVLVIEPVIEGEIEQLFALLRNENNEKREAQRAITESNLSILDSEVFTAEWVFKDKTDLLVSTFRYYNMPFDSEIALKMCDLIGDKINSKPIVLLDLMIIQSLKEAI